MRITALLGTRNGTRRVVNAQGQLRIRLTESILRREVVLVNLSQQSIDCGDGEGLWISERQCGHPFIGDQPLYVLRPFGL